MSITVRTLMHWLPLMCLCWLLPAHGSKPVVALVAAEDDHLVAFVDLLMVELANDPTIALVERDHLTAVVREHQLSQSGLSSRAYALELGKLSGADAVLLLELGPAADHATPPLRLRCVETASGILLTDHLIPLSSKAPAKTITQIKPHFHATWQKLHIAPANRRYIGLLPVRNATGDSRLDAQATALRQLISMALIGSEQVIVLEREDLQIARDESLLAGEEARRLLRSAVLVSADLQPDALAVQLRTPGNPTISQSFPMGDVRRAASAVANWLVQEIGEPATAQIDTSWEAERFCQEADLWIAAKQPTLAIPNAETAYALAPNGERSISTLIKALLLEVPRPPPFNRRAEPYTPERHLHEATLMDRVVWLEKAYQPHGLPRASFRLLEYFASGHWKDVPEAVRLNADSRVRYGEIMQAAGAEWKERQPFYYYAEQLKIRGTLARDLPTAFAGWKEAVLAFAAHPDDHVDAEGNANNSRWGFLGRSIVRGQDGNPAGMGAWDETERLKLWQQTLHQLTEAENPGVRALARFGLIRFEPEAGHVQAGWTLFEREMGYPYETDPYAWREEIGRFLSGFTPGIRQADRLWLMQHFLQPIMQQHAWDRLLITNPRYLVAALHPQSSPPANPALSPEQQQAAAALLRDLHAALEDQSSPAATALRRNLAEALEAAGFALDAAAETPPWMKLLGTLPKYRGGMPGSRVQHRGFTGALREVDGVIYRVTASVHQVGTGQYLANIVVTGLDLETGRARGPVLITAPLSDTTSVRCSSPVALGDQQLLIGVSGIGLVIIPRPDSSQRVVEATIIGAGKLPNVNVEQVAASGRWYYASMRSQSGDTVWGRWDREAGHWETLATHATRPGKIPFASERPFRLLDLAAAPNNQLYFQVFADDNWDSCGAYSHNPQRQTYRRLDRSRTPEFQRIVMRGDALWFIGLKGVMAVDTKTGSRTMLVPAHGERGTSKQRLAKGQDVIAFDPVEQVVWSMPSITKWPYLLTCQSLKNDRSTTISAPRYVSSVSLRSLPSGVFHSDHRGVFRLHMPE